MSRIDRDQLGLLLASVWSLRGTCARRRVGCVLFDVDGHELGTGYNGPAAGEVHCSEAQIYRCAGADLPSGEGLDQCAALHAESNSLLRCRDVSRIWTAYVTHSPCIHCVKLLMNTGCRRIVFRERYAHDAAASELWLKKLCTAGRYKGEPLREWVHLPEVLDDPVITRARNLVR